MSQWIDTSGTYPVMRAKLPRLALQRYQQMLLTRGFTPLVGGCGPWGNRGFRRARLSGRIRGPSAPKTWTGNTDA